MLPAGLRARPAVLFRASAYQEPRRVQSRQPGQAFASFLAAEFRDSMIAMLRAQAAFRYHRLSCRRVEVG